MTLIPGVLLAMAGRFRPSRALACALLLSTVCSAAQARDPDSREFWPEVNVFMKTGEHSRVMLLGSLARNRDYASAVETSYGLYFDFFAAELPDWWLTALPSMEQRWSVWFRFGYNRIVALGGPGDNENRWIAETTLRSEPLLWDIQLANRSRMEWRDIGPEQSWRYRNRTRIERTFAPTRALGQHLGGWLAGVGVNGFVPYAMLEYLYDSRKGDWSRQYQQYGVEIEFSGNRSIDLYGAIQDDLTGTRAKVHALGVVLTLRY